MRQPGAGPGEEPPERCDVAVVGGGILGLAVARELLTRRASESVCVLEREVRLAGHQTGHNSGVVHSGVYYAPGSLKARLCVRGARELAEYCTERDLPYRRLGKLILATGPRELAPLAELERRGRANGVPGLRRLDAAGIAELEPGARGLAALHSPTTAIVDFAQVALALADDVAAAGGTIATGCEAHGLREGPRELLLGHSRGHTRARRAIFCAGAWADRAAIAAGAPSDPRIVPFRGAYLRLSDPRSQPVRGLVYPVPDPDLPFLGVHITPTLDGELLIGPTAVPALARDTRRLGAMRGRDALQTLMWPGAWRLAGRWWRAGAGELGDALAPSRLRRRAARYVPELAGARLERAFAGVRAQAVGRDGRLLEDFAFSVTGRALHVRNAPSPGATSALAIARHVVDEAVRALGT